MSVVVLRILSGGRERLRELSEGLCSRSVAILEIEIDRFHCFILRHFKDVPRASFTMTFIAPEYFRKVLEKIPHRGGCAKT
jgi:hypothetical protein